ncbi:C40 family peptidase [Streptomyces sp. NPDC001205]
MRKLGCLTALVALVACALMVMVLFAARSASRAPAPGQVAAVAGIPARMLAAYQTAAVSIGREVPRCTGMSWAVLAGIAKIESDHAAGHTIAANGDIAPRILGPVLNGSGAGGNTTAVPDSDHGQWDGDASYDRAVGPFQFLPSTWQVSGRDGNGDGRRDPHNADDAALGAAVYLCGDGRNLADGNQLRSAIYQYNHSQAYVDEVLSWVDRYAQLGTGGITVGGSVRGGARTVLNAALQKTGVPYSWGGGDASGPTRGVCCSPGGSSGAGIIGFDCSGLTTYAFAQAGVSLPRTASAQAAVGRRIPASAGVEALQPGDLVFFAYNPASDATIHHVGIYLGGGQMVNAPRPGTVVRSEQVWQSGFAGGARLL